MTTILNRRPFDAATTANNLNSQPIRLQLKKPKNWGWQLTTSKSTPDIVIPMIQLLNYRGSVLLEAVDVGRGCDKQFWSSSELNRKINNDKDCNYHLRQSQATTNICGRRSPLSSGSSTTSIVNGNYKMRTCRAGTLIVTGESFHQSDNHHQRRRRHKSNSCDEVIIPRDYKVDNRYVDEIAEVEKISRTLVNLRIRPVLMGVCQLFCWLITIVLFGFWTMHHQLHP